MIVVNGLPSNNATEGLWLGLVRAEGVDASHYPEGFEEALSAAVAAALGEQDDELEDRRLAARDMLRNGTYKPTGRGKPASEYLVRAAESEFPRINALVDINNLISLEERLPISLWDLDRVDSEKMVFRLGRDGEAYVFNSAGQMLDVRDLVVGCRITSQSETEGEPLVSPIKDSQAAKTVDGTDRVAACVYAPVNVVPESILEDICARFAGWLAGCGRGGAVTHAAAAPGAEVQL